MAKIFEVRMMIELKEKAGPLGTTSGEVTEGLMNVLNRHAANFEILTLSVEPKK